MSVDNRYSLARSSNLNSREFIQLLLSLAIDRVNNGVSKTLTARRTSERPPSDTRHLTDTRTRVSTLLEYSLAYEMNNILEADNQGFSVSAVLWNIFPDLVVRNRQRVNEIGLEVKALHTAAEEKSANFMTPIQLVRRHKDFIVIVNWGWQAGVHEGINITYPHIHGAGVFDAWVMAKIRDYGWLFNQGGRIKGVDIATPFINATAETFKAEEGNLGKLMRIQLPENLPTTFPDFVEMKAEDTLYSSFKDQILALALQETFLDICILEGVSNPVIQVGANYPTVCQLLGNATLPNGVKFYLSAGAKLMKWLASTEAQAIENRSAILWLGTKLDWIFLAKINGHWIRVDQGKKPDSEAERIQGHLRAAHWLETLVESNINES